MSKYTEFHIIQNKYLHLVFSPFGTNIHGITNSDLCAVYIQICPQKLVSLLMTLKNKDDKSFIMSEDFQNIFLLGILVTNHYPIFI